MAALRHTVWNGPRAIIVTAAALAGAVAAGLGCDDAVIQNGAAINPSQGAGAANLYAGDTDFRSGYVEMTFKRPTEDGMVGILLLGDEAAGTYYGCSIAEDSGEMVVGISDINTQAQSSDMVDPPFYRTGVILPSSGTYRLGCELTGTDTIRAYLDEKLVATYVLGTDSADPGYDGGRVGFWVGNANASDTAVEDFKLYEEKPF